MTQPISENELRETHTVFNADHERLRSELLTSLATCSPTSVVVRRGRRWPTWIAITASACLATTILLWISMSGPVSQQAFAIDGIQEKFLQIHSLHVKGTEFRTQKVDGKEVEHAIPIEMYAERPSRYFYTWYGLSDKPDANGIRLKTGFNAVDAEHVFSVSTQDKSAFRYKSDLIATELRVEYLLQNDWLKQIIHGPTSTYQLIGKEDVRGMKTLKYECQEGGDDARTRNLIWMNAATGMPVRSAVYKNDDMKRERLSMVFETIEINVPPPTGMFSFDPPEGFLLKETEDKETDFRLGYSFHGEHCSAQRYSLAIDRLAVLVCWYHGIEGAQPTTPDEDPIIPQVELHGVSNPRKCELHPLGAQLEDDHLWRWSLVVPVDRKPLNSNETLELKFIYPPRWKSSWEYAPLRLDDERLKAAIVRMQELGKPVGEPQPEMTLVRLRWLAARYLTQEAANDQPRDEKR